MRSLLGGGVALLASHLHPSRAAARIPIPQSEPQCGPGFDCAWNGFGAAGAACWARDRGYCDDAISCCGALTCLGGACADVSSALGPGEVCQLDGNSCVYASGAFSLTLVETTQDYRCTDIRSRSETHPVM